MPALPRPSILTPYVPYLQARYLQGERNGVGLFRELVSRGYPGSRMTVERFLQGVASAGAARPVHQLSHHHSGTDATTNDWTDVSSR